MKALKAAARRAVRALGALVVGCLYLLRPFKKIKIGRIRTDRIGHLASNTDAFLRALAAGGLESRFLRVFIAGEPVNRQLLEMYKRVMPIVESRALAKAHDLCIDMLVKTPFHEPLPWRGKAHAEFNAVPPRISFTAEEDARGRCGLAAMGIGENDWFVCFHNRDSAYLRRTQPVHDWSYHDYRDCSVLDFLPAAEFVTAHGGFAVRMGSSVDEPLGATGNLRIIDYADKHRDDFMDVYLLGKCRFLIGCDTGLTLVCTAFDTPVIYTNSPRLDFAPFHRRDLFIQKKYIDSATGRVLSYHEIMARNLEYFLRGEWLKEKGLRLTDNTSEEITDATREMFERLEGTFIERPEDRELQERYRSLFEPRHQSYSFQSRIGRDFLAKNEASLFAPYPREGKTATR